MGGWLVLKLYIMLDLVEVVHQQQRYEYPHQAH